MSYLGIGPASFTNNLTNVQILDDIKAGFNGSTTTFNLTSNSIPFQAVSDRALMVILGGVIQAPGVDYTINLAQITFTTPPVSGLTFYARNIYGLNALNGVNDGIVVPASLSTGGPTWDTSGNTTISGNLTVQGSTTTIQSTTLDVIDKDIKLASNQSTNAGIDTAGLLWGTTAVKLKFYNNGGTNPGLNIEGTNVGINTTAPTEKLHVTGNIKASGTVTGSSFVGGLPITNGADNRVITASSASAIQGESSLTFDGTQLEVNGSSTNYPIKLSGTANAKILLTGSVSPYIQLQEGTTNRAYVYWDSNNNRFELKNEQENTYVRLDSQINFSIGNQEKLRITSEGQGILTGTNSGNHMTSFGSNVGGLTIDDVGGQHTGLEVSHGSNKVFLVASSNNSVYFSSYGTGNLIFEHTGGGGTRERFVINSSGTIQCKGETDVLNSILRVTDATPRIIMSVPSGGLDTRLFNDGSGNFIIGHGVNSDTPTERLKITSAGKTVFSEEIETPQDYPNYRPTLDFNFAAVKKLDPRITYTRTGPASYVDEFGKVVLVGDNAPRFDHDIATRECKGLLIEETRTNLVTNSTLRTDGAEGNITKTRAEGPDGVFDSALQVTYTASGGAFIRSGAVSCSASTEYTFSIWIKKVSGSVNGTGAFYSYLTGSSSHGLFNTSGLVNSEGQTLNAQPAGVWRRFTQTKTTDGSTSAIDFVLPGYDSNGLVLQYYGLQLEAGGHATSFILTEGSTAARGSDDLVIDGGEFTDFINKPEGTILADYKVIGGNPEIMYISNGNANCRIGLYEAGSSQTRFLVNNAGTQADTTDSAGTTVGDNIKSAGAYKLNDVAASKNGVISSTDSSVTIPDGIDTAYIGGYYNGDVEGALGLRRLVYYQQRLPNSQLVTLTA